MKKILIAICAVLVLAAVAVAAQPGGGPHGRMHGKMRGEMRGEMMEAHFAALNLTEDQKTAVRQLHEDLAARTEPLMERLHEQHEELRGLLDGANPDPATVGSQVIAAHQTRTQLKALHDDFKTRFSALLNDEQREKLEAFHERREGRGEMRHRFPGFGHGPGF